MDLIQTGLRSTFFHSLLNVFLPPLAITCLLFTLPPYLLFKSLLFLFRPAFPEDVSGKVVLITGTSSGIGDHLAYSYAKRDTCLALVARRENQQREVADMAYHLGSRDVISIQADVSEVEDCQSFIDDVVRYFGRLDHLVANAGIAPVSLLEDCPDVTKLAPAMDINFWGSVYSSYFALPHLRRSRGMVIAIASSAAWLPVPRMSVYNATKAAVVSFYETLGAEMASDITITIVTPGLVESEMTQGKFLSRDGRMVLDPELRDVQVSVMPIRSVEVAAEEIVKGVCRGDNYITEPAWIKSSFYWKVFCPEVLEWINRTLLVAGADYLMRRARSREILELSGLKNYLYPEPLINDEIATG